MAVCAFDLWQITTYTDGVGMGPTLRWTRMTCVQPSLCKTLATTYL